MLQAVCQETCDCGLGRRALFVEELGGNDYVSELLEKSFVVALSNFRTDEGLSIREKSILSVVNPHNPRLGMTHRASALQSSHSIPFP